MSLQRLASNARASQIRLEEAALAKLKVIPGWQANRLPPQRPISRLPRGAL